MSVYCVKGKYHYFEFKHMGERKRLGPFSSREEAVEKGRKYRDKLKNSQEYNHIKRAVEEVLLRTYNPFAEDAPPGHEWKPDEKGWIAVKQRTMTGEVLEKPKATLGELWFEYERATRRTDSDDWHQDKKNRFNTWFHKWRHMPYDEISKGMLGEHMMRRKKDGVGAHSRNKDAMLILSIYNWAEKEGLIPKNHLKGMKLDPEPAKVPRIPKDTDVKRIKMALPSPWDTVFLVVIYTVSRISEALKLRWQDINFETKVILKRNCKTRSSNERISPIPISNELNRALQDMYAKRNPDNPLVFPSPENGGIRTNHKMLSRILEREGIPHYSWHDFRHWGASILAHRMKANPFHVKDALGHWDVQTTQQYVHSIDKALEKTMGDYSSELDRIFSEEEELGTVPNHSESQQSVY